MSSIHRPAFPARPRLPQAAWPPVRRWPLQRPGLRAVVFVTSSILVAAMAIAVSGLVSDHLARVAMAEATRAATTVVRANVDPLLAGTDLAHPTEPGARSVDGFLSRLVGTGQIVRIKIWAPDGTIAYSDLAALRGRRFAVDDDLGEALLGKPSAGLSAADDEENVFERGLAEQFLSIYVPIVAADGTTVTGAYEIYEDAAPIEAEIAATRRDVALVVGAAAVGLFLLLWFASAATSRRLSRQNRRLREQAATELLLATDLRRSEERFRSLVQNSADIILVIHADRTVAYESPAVERVLGYRVEDRIGRPILEPVHADDRTGVDALLSEAEAAPGRQVRGAFRLRHADGSWRVVDITATNLLDDPAVGGIVVNYRDVTEQRRLEEELRHQAFHDTLTGLANRALFGDRLGHALERSARRGESLAVMFLDLDDFKTVNDSLGHGEGDRLLVAVAERLQASLRTSDTVARMGGDEFAILLEDAPDRAFALEVAQRLLTALEVPFELAGRRLVVRASVGIARSGPETASPDELLRDADAAMYTAKRQGKHRIEVFTPGMHVAALARLVLKEDLERALDRGEFFLAYQPIVELAGATLTGVEALLRWNHPTRGLVGPNEFIPVAEETGIILELGRWVLGEACRQAVAWAAGGARPLTMNVNVSGRQVHEGSLVADVRSALASTGLVPDRLVLEFTETVLIGDRDTVRTLDDLKELGVRLAIDDFGTGYSSLSYLRQFPVDVLKIDGSFVASAPAGSDKAALLRAIVNLGRTLGLAMVAEGIEEAAQVAALRSLGPMSGQGYLFSRPIDAGAIGDLLARDDLVLPVGPKPGPRATSRRTAGTAADPTATPGRR